MGWVEVGQLTFRGQGRVETEQMTFRVCNWVEVRPNAFSGWVEAGQTAHLQGMGLGGS